MIITYFYDWWRNNGFKKRPWRSFFYYEQKSFLMHHAFGAVLQRECPILPRGCGMGWECSAPVPIKLWTPDRFWSWLLALAQNVCWPQAMAGMAPGPGTPWVGNPRALAKPLSPGHQWLWLAQACLSNTEDLLEGGPSEGCRAISLCRRVRAIALDVCSSRAPGWLRESVGGLVGPLSSWPGNLTYFHVRLSSPSLVESLLRRL